MTELGANPAQLDDLAALIGGLAGDLSHRRLALTAWIEGDRFWRGNRANEFRHEWTSTYAPLMANACDYLNSAVKTLHENANQQRVASGESPRDYGGGSFLHRLFHDAVHDVEHAGSGVLHGLERFGQDALKGVGDVWRVDYSAFKELGGSKLFAEVLGAVQVVGTVAAFCPPPIDSVALVAGGVVLVGHLAQMANRGRFNAGEFAMDTVNMASGGAVKALSNVKKLEGIAHAAGSANIVHDMTDVAARAKLLTYAGDAARKTTLVAVAGVRVVKAGADAVHTSVEVGGDLAQGKFHDAVMDSAGYGGAILDLGGKHVANMAHAIPLIQQVDKVEGTNSVQDGMAELGGYQQ